MTKRISHKNKVKIWVRDNWRCKYCLKKLDMETATVDHIIGKASGGKDNSENLTTSCRKCNFEKSVKENYQAGINKMLRKIKL